MNMTPWPTNTSSSIATPSQTKAWLWILQSRADDGAALDLDERADPRAVADPAAVEVGERLHDDVIAELDVVDQAVRGLVGRPVSHGRSSRGPPRPRPRAAPR